MAAKHCAVYLLLGTLAQSAILSHAFQVFYYFGRNVSPFSKGGSSKVSLFLLFLFLLLVSIVSLWFILAIHWARLIPPFLRDTNEGGWHCPPTPVTDTQVYWTMSTYDKPGSFSMLAWEDRTGSYSGTVQPTYLAAKALSDASSICAVSFEQSNSSRINPVHTGLSIPCPDMCCNTH